VSGATYTSLSHEALPQSAPDELGFKAAGARKRARTRPRSSRPQDHQATQTRSRAWPSCSRRSAMATA
jgi:hypothetical protein